MASDESVSLSFFLFLFPPLHQSLSTSLCFSFPFPIGCLSPNLHSASRAARVAGLKTKCLLANYLRFLIFTRPPPLPLSSTSTPLFCNWMNLNNNDGLAWCSVNSWLVQASCPHSHTCEETGWSPRGFADGYSDARKCKKKKFTWNWYIFFISGDLKDKQSAPHGNPRCDLFLQWKTLNPLHPSNTLVTSKPMDKSD